MFPGEDLFAEFGASPALCRPSTTWLSIPLFARPPGQLTHVQRMEILQKAYDKVDKTGVSITSWLVVVAQA